MFLARYVLMLFALTGLSPKVGCQSHSTKTHTTSMVSYNGPIIDAHSHPRKSRMDALEKHFEKLSTSGVERMIVMTTPNDYRKAKRLKGLNRAAYIKNVSILCTANFVGFAYQGELVKAQRILNGIDRDLKNKKCIGIGEVGLRHFNKRKDGSQHVVEMDLDHQLIHQALSIANVYSVPIVLIDFFLY